MIAHIKKLSLTLGHISRKAYLKFWLTMAIITSIGLSTVGHYGISWDEFDEIWGVFLNYQLVTEGKPLPPNSHFNYYGIVFSGTSEAIFQGKEFLSKGFSYNPLKEDLKVKGDRVKSSARTYERIKVKHILTFLLSLATYVSVAGIVGILVNWEYAWFGPVILALFPRFWGHSFFNPKDIPFAAMFTLATFLGACLVGCYLKAEQEELKLGINKITIYSLLYGILLGLVTGIRIGGFLLLFFIVFAHLVTILGKGSVYRYFLRFWIFYGVIFICWMATTTIVYPASWSNPVGWFVEAVQYLSKHEWSGKILFEGQFISAQSLPWHYLPKWLVITIPLIFQISFLLGLFLVISRYKKLTPIKRACVILVLLQIFFLPAIAILKQSTIYNGMRQFLFMLPGIAAFSATALIWLYQKISRKNVRIFAVALIIILFSPIVFDMVALHPYEYIYFNRIFGGLKGALNRYETDYWGLSMREGVEWINDNASSKATIVSSQPWISSKIFAAPSIHVILDKEFEQTGTSKPFYYLTLPQGDSQSKFPDCSVVYSVKRQDVPLTIVKKCD